MSCVTLIASITPCNDAAAFNEKGVIVIIKEASNHNCNADADLCSPLCVCNCCAGCSMYYSFPKIKNVNIESSVNYASFLNSILRKVSLPVWQPPQLN